MADTNSEVKQEITSAAQEANAAQAEHESAVDATHSAEENVAKSIAKAKKGVQDSIEAAKQAREEADGYNAEEQAAAQGEVISIEEALALIKQQEKADKMATKAQMQAFSDSVEFVGTAVVETAGMVLDNSDALLNGLKDGVTSKAILPYLGTVGLGAGVGLFVQNEEIQSMVINGVNAFYGLGGEHSENEEKFVGGVETPEDQAAWLAENGNGTPSDPYAASQPATADSDTDKEVQGGTKTNVNTGLEATEASDTELGDLADLDKVTSGEALFGDTALGHWMDDMAKMFDESKTSNPAMGLATAIAEHAMPGIGAVAETVLGKVGPQLSKLMAAKDEVDQNAANKGPENDGPEATV